MKKTIALVLALVMCLALCACGAKAPEAPAASASASASAEPAPAAVTYGFLEESLGTETYAIGFRKGEQELADQVSAAVKALVKNGTYAAIGEKYPDIKDYLCLKPEDISDSEIAQQGSGDSGFTFKHGFDLDYPPYSYLKDDGSVGGFDVELCQAVCEYLGWGDEAVPFNWDFKDAELNAKSCDCIWSGFTKEGREDMYDWGVAYSLNTQMILVASDSGIEKLSDLAGKTVGVQISTSAAEMLEDEERQKGLADTFKELKVYETYPIAFNDLQAGAIDAIAIDVTTGTYLINNVK